MGFSFKSWSRLFITVIWILDLVLCEWNALSNQLPSKVFVAYNVLGKALLQTNETNNKSNELPNQLALGWRLTALWTHSYAQGLSSPFYPFSSFRGLVIISELNWGKSWDYRSKSDLCELGLLQPPIQTISFNLRSFYYFFQYQIKITFDTKIMN